MESSARAWMAVTDAHSILCDWRPTIAGICTDEQAAPEAGAGLARLRDIFLDRRPQSARIHDVAWRPFPSHFPSKKVLQSQGPTMPILRSPTNRLLMEVHPSSRLGERIEATAGAGGLNSITP